MQSPLSVERAAEETEHAEQGKLAAAEHLQDLANLEETRFGQLEQDGKLHAEQAAATELARAKQHKTMAAPSWRWQPAWSATHCRLYWWHEVTRERCWNPPSRAAPTAMAAKFLHPPSQQRQRDTQVVANARSRGMPAYSGTAAPHRQAVLATADAPPVEAAPSPGAFLGGASPSAGSANEVYNNQHIKPADCKLRNQTLESKREQRSKANTMWVGGTNQKTARTFSV